jgi:hypothetical protein
VSVGCTGALTLTVGRGRAVAVPVDGLEQAALAPANTTVTATMATGTTRTADTPEPSSTRIPS